jgi:hypothetical protein
MKTHSAQNSPSICKLITKEYNITKI